MSDAPHVVPGVPALGALPPEKPRKPTFLRSPRLRPAEPQKAEQPVDEQQQQEPLVGSIPAPQDGGNADAPVEPVEDSRSPVSEAAEEAEEEEEEEEEEISALMAEEARHKPPVMKALKLSMNPAELYSGVSHESTSEEQPEAAEAEGTQEAEPRRLNAELLKALLSPRDLLSKLGDKIGVSAKAPEIGSPEKPPGPGAEEAPAEGSVTSRGRLQRAEGFFGSAQLSKTFSENNLSVTESNVNSVPIAALEQDGQSASVVSPASPRAKTKKSGSRVKRSLSFKKKSAEMQKNKSNE